MFAFYKVSSGEIISVVQASSQAGAPEGYGYVDYNYDVSETYKYEVSNGALVAKTQADVDAIEVSKAEVMLRRKRDQMLAACDWTQVPDAPVDSQAWATYRQALRDLPANTTDPRDVAWPEKP